MLRRFVATAVVVAVVCVVKIGIGDALGRQAPFALLGLGVLGAGWAAGAGAALPTTVILTLVSWRLSFGSAGAAESTSSTSALQLTVFFLEGLAISGIVAAMDRARRVQVVTARWMETLQTLTAALALARTQDEVAEILVKRTAEFLGATTGVLVLPNADGRLRIAAIHGTAEGPAGTAAGSPVEEASPEAKAFRTGQTEWIEDRATHLERYPRREGQAGHGSPAGVVSLPLYAAGRILGSTTYRFPVPRRFPEAERATIRGYVTQAAQVLDRTLASSREIVAGQRLQALADVSIALSAASTTQEVVDVIVDRGTNVMGADTCTLYVATEPDRTLDLAGHRGVAAEVLERIRRISASSENPSFHSLSTGTPIWGESEDDYLALYPRIATIRTEAPRARAFWSVPLIVEGHAVGLLGMGFYRPRRFPADERSFIETFAGHCSQAMMRARRLEAEQRARRAAEHAEASLTTTLRSIGDAVIATDLGGNVTFMNPIAEQLTGWPAGEARGRPLGTVFKIVNEQTRREAESPVDKVLESGAVVGLANHTVLLSRVEGQETPIDDSGAPIRDELGRVQGVVLVFRDVTEKKKAEARRSFVADATATLASSLDYQATLIRLARLLVPDFADWSAVDVLDPESPTPRRLAVMHVDPAKVQLAHDLAERYPDPPDSPTGVPNVLRTGQSEIYPDITEEMVMAGARDDEHRRMALGLRLRSAMIVPLVARGRTLGAISLVHAESGRRYTPDDLAFIEDIARRAAVAIDNAHLYASERQARLAADIANRMKDEFLATVSHELRTPLNAILGWARMMSKAPDDEQRRVRAVEVIERNSVAMAKLIEDLLDISRIISGTVRLDRESIDPIHVIQAAVDSVRPTFEAKGVRVRIPTDASAGAPASPQTSALMVVGDSSRLQQVLCNLLNNAIKFTPKGGQIDVEICRRAAFLEIEVSDSGKGIDPEFLPHVFEPFRQADGSITRAHGGLGLGLAISRHLVELHGGQIRAESAGPGQGATFIVSLPIDLPPELSSNLSSNLSSDKAVQAMPVPSNERTASQEGASEQRADLQGVRILAVDDDADARQLVSAVLQERGAVVRVAGSALDAMRALEAEVPDVLLSDIGMPGEDGYTLIRKVRSLPPDRGGNVPAAALTAYTRAEDRRQVIAAGYSMHLPKPIDPDRLIAVVESLARGTPDSSR